MFKIFFSLIALAELILGLFFLIKQDWIVSLIWLNGFLFLAFILFFDYQLDKRENNG